MEGKSELRVRPHLVLPGQQVFEVWYNGELIGMVTGADGPGIRFLSKHDVLIREDFEIAGAKVVEIRVSTNVILARAFPAPM